MTRLFERAADAYTSFFSAPPKVVNVAFPAAAVVIVASAGLLVFGPSQDLWQVFDHTAGALAIAGLLLAFPALAYAASTEKIVERTYTVLSREEGQLPVEIREVRNVAAERRDVSAEEELNVAPAPAGPPVPGGLTDQPDGFPTVEPAMDERFRSFLASWIVDSAGNDPDDLPNAVTRRELEAAIRGSSGPPGVSTVLSAAQVLALGYVAGDLSVPGRGTKSDLIHFSTESDEDHRVLLPVFTNVDILRDALIRNPHWQEVPVLEIDGGKILNERDSDVTLVVDPWSELEFQIPP